MTLQEALDLAPDRTVAIVRAILGLEPDIDALCLARTHTGKPASRAPKRGRKKKIAYVQP